MQQLQLQQQSQVEEPAAIEQALSYFTTIKLRFEDDPDTLQKFLDILDAYQKRQKEVKEVWDEISVIFVDHPDLIKDFIYFLSDDLKEEEEKLQLERDIEELCGERGIKDLFLMDKDK